MKEAKILPIEEPLHVDLFSDSKQVIGTKGMTIIPNKLGLDFSKYDYLIIPGGQGVETIATNQELIKQVAEFGKTKTVCSIGLGSLILALAGLLKDKKATTHHKHYVRLSKYCTVENKRIVIDDNIITAGGMICAIDLAAEIIERCYSKTIADIVLDYIEHTTKRKGVRLDIGEIDDE